MIKLAHYDDGKCKHQSHAIDILGESIEDMDLIWLRDIEAWGDTKEEALQEFKKKFNKIYCEVRYINNLLRSDLLDNDIVEVDWRGKPIK